MKLFSQIVRIFLIAFVVNYSTSIKAQEKKDFIIFGLVTDSADLALPFANVLLLKSNDSSLVKGGVCDDKGRYSIQTKLLDGTYLISFTSMGYNTFYKQLEMPRDGLQVDVGAVRLGKKNIGLKEVEVTKSIPFMELKGDKLVVNMENRPAGLGNNALDALERTPGVMVNKSEGAITLLGRSGIRIQINGRTLRTENAQLLSSLEAMPSDNISKIEIISNPSSKYDAEAGAILNIILKKPQDQGLNADLKASVGYGKYLKYTGGVNVNYNHSKFTTYIITNAGESKNSYLDNTQINLFNKPFVSLFRRENLKNDLNSYIRTGIDLYIDTLNTVGLIYTSNSSIPQTDSKTLISQTLKSTDSSSNLADQRSNITGSRFDNTISSYYTHKLHYGKGSIDCNFDWINSQFGRSYDSKVVNNNSSVTDYYENTLNNKINIVDLYINTSMKTLKNATLEFGGKTSFVNSNSSSIYEREKTLVDSLGMQYVYKQNITALYCAIEKPLSNMITAKIGLRSEYEKMSGNNLLNQESIKKDNLLFFPSASISFSPAKKHKFSFAYSSRIFRITFDNFAGIKRYINLNTYSQGNPQLLPLYIKELNINYMFNQMLFTEIGYSRVKNAFFQKATETTSGTMITYRNADYMEQMGVNLSLNNNIKQWWNSSISFAFFLQGFYSDSESISSSLFKTKPFHSLKTSQTFTVQKCKIEWSFWYSGLIYLGMDAVMPRYGSDLAVKRSFGERWNLTLALYDVLLSTKQTVQTTSSVSSYLRSSSNDSRQLWLKVIYKLGNLKTRKSNMRNFQNADINSRTQSDL